MSDNSNAMKESAIEMETFVKKLAFPRYFGTEHDVQARNIIKDECTHLGLDFEIDPFKASDFYVRHLYRIPYFMFAAYVFIFSFLIIAGAATEIVITMAILLIIITLTIDKLTLAVKYRGIFSRFAKFKDSENIILEKKVAGQKENMVELFLVAHEDSKSEIPDWKSRLALMVAEYFVIYFGSWILAIHAIIYSIFTILDNGTLPYSPWIFSYGIFFAIIDLMRTATAFFEGDSPGATDDAIGVAELIEFMKRIQGESLTHVHITTLISAGEEVGSVGMYSFLKKRLNSLASKNCHFIINDSISSFKIDYYTSHGFLFHPFSQLVKEAVENLVNAGNESTAEFSFYKRWMYPPSTTDHTPAVMFGFPAFVFESNVTASHTKYDTPDRIDFAASARFVEFLVALVQEIDSIMEKQDSA